MNGSLSSSLFLQNIVVTDVSISTGITNGGVGYINCGFQIWILSCEFSNIGTGKKGGVFYFVNISSDISIRNCNFTEITGNEEGGAIIFSEGTTFIINQSSFINCKSVNGYGGAFSSSSTKTGSRGMYYCIFDGNTGWENVGLDIYDSSNYSNSFYSFSNVAGCVSTSTFDGEYILFAGTQV